MDVDNATAVDGVKNNQYGVTISNNNNGIGIC